MIKKMMLLAVSAAAVVAFAVPATASAEWTKEGEPLTENEHVTFSGPANFQIPGTAGAQAEIHATLNLIAGTTTAEVVSFEDTNCEGTLAFAGLSCTGEARNLPWIAHVSGETIQITNIDLLTRYYAGSHGGPVVRESVLKGNIIATPDNREAIGSVTLSGEGTTANGAPATVSGKLGASPAGVFGF